MPIFSDWERKDKQGVDKMQRSGQDFFLFFLLWNADYRNYGQSQSESAQSATNFCYFCEQQKPSKHDNEILSIRIRHQPDGFFLQAFRRADPRDGRH